MSNESTINNLKRFEGRKLKEVKDMGPNNWAMIFEAEDGTFPSLNFLTDTSVFIVEAK